MTLWSVYWSASYWILLANQVQNDLHIIKQGGWSNAWHICGHLRVGSCKLLFIQVEIAVITNTQTLLSFFLSLIPGRFCRFLFSRNVKTKKKSLIGDYFLKYCSFFTKLLKTNPVHCYEIEKKNKINKNKKIDCLVLNHSESGSKCKQKLIRGWNV